MTSPPPLSLNDLLSERRWLVSLSRHLMSSPNDAEDVAQETLVRALEHEERIPALARRNWLAATARNIALSTKRARYRRVSRERIKSRPEIAEDSDVAELTALAEYRARAANGVIALPEAYRSVIVLRFYEGLGTAEVAQRLSIEPAAVRKRLSRAIQRLRTSLDKDDHERTWGVVALTQLRENSGYTYGTSGAKVALSATPVLMTLAMKTLVILAAALAAAPLALWGLSKQTTASDPVISQTLETAAAPESNAPELLPVESELAQPHEELSAARSVLEPPDEAVMAAATAVADSDQRPKASALTPAIEVLVVDAANRPVDGAFVRLNDLSKKSSLTTLDHLKGGSVTKARIEALGRAMAQLEAGSPARSRAGLGGTARVKTNEQGLATLTPTGDGRMRLIAQADGFAPGASDAFDVAAHTLSVRIEITLTEGGSVAGQLLDVRGAPAAGVRVSVHSDRLRTVVGLSPPAQMKTTVTAEDGTFLFENLTPWNYNLSTRAEDEALELVPNERVELTVEEGKRTMVEFAEVSDSYVRLRGTVTRNSEPVANASINISWADRSRGYLRKKAKADDEGAFSIILDEGGKYRFQISDSGSSGSVFQMIDVPSVQDHEVLISFDTGSLSGSLLGPKGEPIEGVVITAFGDFAQEGAGTTIQKTSSQTDGTFEFADLVSGTYKLKARTIPNIALMTAVPAPKLPYLGSAEVVDLSLSAGESLVGVQLTMSAAAAIDGMVSDPGGGELAGAEFEIQGDSPLDASRWIVDESGKFLAGGIKPGSYRVRAVQKDLITPWVSVEASAMTTTHVDGLILQPGTLIDLQAQTNEESTGRLYASIFDADKRRVESGILHKGKLQLGPLFPGSYTVTVNQRGDTKHKVSEVVIVKGEPTLSVEVDLRR